MISRRTFLGAAGLALAAGSTAGAEPPAATGLPGNSVGVSDRCALRILTCPLRSITPEPARQRPSFLRADADCALAMAACSPGSGGADRQLLFPAGCQTLALGAGPASNARQAR